jgi:nitroreductase
MDLFDAIGGRRSVRQFRPDAPVPEGAVRKILEAGIMAPSAGNVQAWRFIVVRDEALKARLATEAGHQLFIKQAPVAIVVLADLARTEAKYGERGRGTYALQETAAAIENMLLAAHAQGLGSCWIGAFDEAAAARILGLGGGLRPVAILPIGVPAEPTSRVPPRRALGEVAEFR